MVTVKNQPLPAPLHCFRFFPYSEGGVLFLEGSRRIWTLNPTAAVVWCLLEEVNSFEELVSEITDRFSVERKRAYKDIEGIIESFRREGLFDRSTSRLIYDGDEHQELSGYELQLQDGSLWKVKCTLNILGCGINFKSQDEELGNSFYAIMDYFIVDESIPGVVLTFGYYLLVAVSRLGTFI